jgi:uncharacterized protein YbjT (DUF2867 family)
MNVLVAGGHGKVALRLLRVCAERGDWARGLIRKPEQAGDLESTGAEPVIFDLEADDDLARHVAGSDAVVFAAGAGPGSGADRKRTVDCGGAVKLIDACRASDVGRYVMVSSMGVRRPGEHSGPMEPYLDAKAEADERLRASGLDYTIVRPGRLSDESGSGLIEVGAPLERRGEVPRDDVAATLVAVLDEPRTTGLTFDLLGGQTSIADAVAALVEDG